MPATSALNVGKPLTLPCGVTVKHRFCKSAMNEALAGRDCAPTKKQHGMGALTPRRRKGHQ